MMRTQAGVTRRGMIMRALYVMDNGMISDELTTALWPYCHLVLDGTEATKDDKRLLELVRSEAHEYTLDPNLPELPTDIRFDILLGKADQDKWSLCDVHLVMVEDGAIAWVAQY
jgi:hypothetical protein